MTRQQWFETLPAPYAERAIDNSSVRDLVNTCADLRDSLVSGFVWEDSPEGHDFWRAVSLGELPPIADEEPTPDPVPSHRYFRHRNGIHYRTRATGDPKDCTDCWRSDDGGITWVDSIMHLHDMIESGWGRDGITEYFPTTIQESLTPEPASEPAPVTTPPEFLYFISRVTNRVWRMPESGNGETREEPHLAWRSSCFDRADMVHREADLCDEHGNLLTSPAAPATPTPTTEFRVRPGYRYLTRGGQTTGYMRCSGDSANTGTFRFEADIGETTRTFTERGEWNPPDNFDLDLVEEIQPTTIEEWLHTIPESEVALRHMTSQRESWHYPSDGAATSATDALGRGFSWGSSPEGHDYWSDVHSRLLQEGRAQFVATPRAARPVLPMPPPAPAPPPSPPPAPKLKYRITEVRHYFLEAEDEIEADKLFLYATDPARKFRMHIEDREIHNDA